MHKKQEREIHSQEEKWWAETDSEWRQTIDLAEKSLQKILQMCPKKEKLFYYWGNK